MAKKAPQDPPELPFEEALDRLEALVEAMDHGDLELEDSLRKFEEGIKLVRRCSERIRDAELRVKQLEVDAGGARERGTLEQLAGRDDRDGDRRDVADRAQRGTRDEQPVGALAGYLELSARVGRGSRRAAHADPSWVAT